MIFGIIHLFHPSYLSLSLSSRQTFALDASASVDPDDTTGANGALTFAWSCATSSGALCYTTDTQQPLALPATSVVSLSSLSLLPGNYVFSVSISKGTRTAGPASTTIQIASAPVPTVQLGVTPSLINPTYVLA